MGNSNIDLTAMALAQKTCRSIPQLQSSSSLHLQFFPAGQQSLCCDVSGGGRRPVVPLTWRKTVFNTLHSLAHPGIRASRRLISFRFVGKGMATDVSQWCRECAACQNAKITTQQTAPIHPIPVPACRFSYIHVDLVGPLPVSAGGHSHIMTFIDRSTHWVEVVPLSSTMPWWPAGLHALECRPL